MPSTEHAATLDQAVQTLASKLQHASQALQAAAEALDTAHQHAAHLAVINPDQDPARRGQNSCRSVGPTHLTRRKRDFAQLPDD